MSETVEMKCYERDISTPAKANAFLREVFCDEYGHTFGKNSAVDFSEIGTLREGMRLRIVRRVESYVGEDGITRFYCVGVLTIFGNTIHGDMQVVRHIHFNSLDINGWLSYTENARMARTYGARGAIVDAWDELKDEIAEFIRGWNICYDDLHGFGVDIEAYYGGTYERRSTEAV